MSAESGAEPRWDKYAIMQVGDRSYLTHVYECGERLMFLPPGCVMVHLVDKIRQHERECAEQLAARETAQDRATFHDLDR